MNYVTGIPVIRRSATPPIQAKTWVAAGLMLVVLLFAAQWYAYDRTRGTASPYLYYVGWSCLMWGLAPLVLWFGRSHPIRRTDWKQSVPFHAGVSVGLSTIQVSIEAALGWLRHGLQFQPALAHYFVQHLQLYLLTYWVLIAAAQFYRVQSESHDRELRAVRLETQLSAARLQSLRSQLQPHFLFNTLHAAVGLVHEDPAGAEDILLQLSQLLRASLVDFLANETSLRKEMEFIDCYISIQQRRFGERLRVERHIDDRVLNLAVPSLILQPLVENSILHGIGKHEGDDVIAVNAFADERGLILEVRNQISALDDVTEILFSRGVGLANTRARLQELYGNGQTMELLNLEPRGVCIRLIIPLRRLPQDAAAQTIQNL
jgi:two-component system, LytTR family, sensor kinase